MSKINDLYDDMEKLNALYEEHLWDHNDPLTFQIDCDKIVIRNINQEQRDQNI